MENIIDELIKVILLFIKQLIKFIAIAIILAIGFMIIIIIINNYYKRNNNNNNNNIIETDIALQKHNDSLKIEVDNLDSIKNAKVIEVQTLNNDSTVKLFYKLIK